MQIHDIRPTHKRKARKRIGRGGKRGTYSGRGVKGQASRAGARSHPLVRELFKRYPKLRGYKARRNEKYKAIVTLDMLEKNFKKGDAVNPEVLVKKHLMRTIRKRVPPVKILGKGKLTKALNVEGCECSKSVKEQIEKAGGTITS